MKKQDYDDIIVFEIAMELEDKGLKRIHLTDKEYYKTLYERALEKLEDKCDGK
jgi:hypothetical protein